MNGSPFRNLLSSKWGFLVLAIVLIGFAFLINKWQNKIEAIKTHIVREYRIDLDISRHKAEHLDRYQKVVENFRLPETKTLRQNEWIQFAQGLAQDQKLSLRELKPVYSAGKKDAKAPDVFLALEGTVPDVLRFLYKIAQADNAVYVEKLLFSSATGQTETVRAQMTLSQVEGKERHA